MTPKRFKSKIDRWLLLLLVAIMVFEVVVMGIAAIDKRIRAIGSGETGLRENPSASADGERMITGHDFSSNKNILIKKALEGSTALVIIFG